MHSSASPRTAAVWWGFGKSDHVVLKVSIQSSALPCSVAVWLGFWNSDHVVLKSNIHCSALPWSVAVWLTFWDSDHVVLKSNICTSASPRQQHSHWLLMVTQDTYFSLLTHAKQLLLVTLCETTARNRKKWKCDVRTYGRKDGRTDRREVWNSYLDSNGVKI